ncbi:hypothetical protein F2P81_010376 [Scophthalmus maximus]|uniref:ATF7-interacting protein protein binding domain-containing protein n=1 Tax=Scophthalmus maximus TaxID=52904 RepID=A0A6A4T5M5_SCOMX|nr:hypothetical protein F2P81_010376 [Scophthalmus maximus]
MTSPLLACRGNYKFHTRRLYTTGSVRVQQRLKEEEEEEEEETVGHRPFLKIAGTSPGDAKSRLSLKSNGCLKTPASCSAHTIEHLWIDVVRTSGIVGPASLLPPAVKTLFFNAFNVPVTQGLLLVKQQIFLGRDNTPLTEPDVVGYTLSETINVAAMEVVVTEEKKKIFRARKTMKISDRQQLESLHSTLLTTAPGLSNPSPPPLMNGTHKEDGQKVGDKEQNNTLDSNSPHAVSPASPAPFLSLSLSPSPASSQSPKAKEGTPTSPTSPFHSLNFELKKMEEDEDEEKTGSLPPSLNDPVTLAETESKEKQGKKTEVIPEVEKKTEEQTTAEDPAEDLVKESVKGLVPHSPVPPQVSDCTEPMDTDNDTTKAEDPEASKAKMTDKKPSSPKSITSDSSPSCSSSCHPASSSGANLKQEKAIKKEGIKKEKGDKEDVKKRSISVEKMEVDLVSVQTKEEKTPVGKTPKPSRPSSTPPSNTVLEERGSTSGLKRTLSEGSEKEVQIVKREGKRPKVEREELEAQLELKITAKAGSHHKLEKIVQQLVDERLRVLELTIFGKDFEELKDRVDKIDCATKHQTAINALQAKIARLAKKFGEANQASENKRKQEALAAATAASAAATAASAAKTAAAANSPQVQRVLRRQTVEQQPRVPSEGVAPSVGKTPPLSVKKEKIEEEMEEEEDKDLSRNIAMAKKLAEYNEGRCREDINLRMINAQLEKVLYQNCKRSSGNPRPDRYASYVFRSLVPYDVYCDWVSKVNYVGLMGKEALPTNLRRTMRMYIERRFPLLTCDSWREIRDVINEILRVKRRPEFFREYNQRTTERIFIY